MKLSSPKDEEKIPPKLHWWSCKRETKQDKIIRLLKEIMATQAELVDKLKVVGTQLTDLSTEVDKVGKETDSLNQKIADLEAALANQPNATQELSDAVDAVATQVGVVSAVVKAVDDKVPDAPTS